MNNVEIRLTQGKVAVIDERDLEKISAHRWCAHKKRGKWRAIARTGGATLYMHRLIARPPNGRVVDHVDGDGLNNTRENLRICTGSQNLCNRGRQVNNTSGYKGVALHRPSGRWYAWIQYKNTRTCLGCFGDPKDAARAYDRAAIQLHGRFAKTNEMAEAF